jgi:outer membrane PBP1 activator LpoA protein
MPRARKVGIPALLAVLLVAPILTACETENPCDAWERLDKQAYDEGNYFKYEDQIKQAKDSCIANGGV